jgi:WD40 repeat protein
MKWTALFLLALVLGINMAASAQANTLPPLEPITLQNATRLQLLRSYAAADGFTLATANNTHLFLAQRGGEWQVRALSDDTLLTSAAGWQPTSAAFSADADSANSGIAAFGDTLGEITLLPFDQEGIREDQQQFLAAHSENTLVYSVGLSADGAVLASGGQDGVVTLWDMANLDAPAITLGQATPAPEDGISDQSILGVAVSADGGTLVFNRAQDVQVYNIIREDGFVSLPQRYVLDTFADRVGAVSISADSSLIAVPFAAITDDQPTWFVYVLDAASGTVMHNITLSERLLVGSFGAEQTPSANNGGLVGGDAERYQGTSISADGSYLLIAGVGLMAVEDDAFYDMLSLSGSDCTTASLNPDQTLIVQVCDTSAQLWGVPVE